MADPVGPRYDALSMEDEVYMGTPNVGLMQPTANKSLDDKEFLALYTKVCS